jgi:hypothetical protein
VCSPLGVTALAISNGEGMGAPFLRL